MYNEVKRTEDEISEQLNRAQAQTDKGGTQVRGMSYEQGVDDALRWVLGMSDDKPLDDDLWGDDGDDDDEG